VLLVVGLMLADRIALLLPNLDLTTAPRIRSDFDD
jgi:hypothetical protein